MMWLPVYTILILTIQDLKLSLQKLEELRLVFLHVSSAVLSAELLAFFKLVCMQVFVLSGLTAAEMCIFLK